MKKENQQLEVEAARAEVERLRKANEALRKSLASTESSADTPTLPLSEEQKKLREENEKLRSALVQAECERLRKENEAFRKRAAEAAGGPVIEDEGSPQFVSAAFTPEEFQRLQEDNKKLREQLRMGANTPIRADANVNGILSEKYHGQPVSTKKGKLTIGGLLQVWYYSIRNDGKAWVDADKAAGTFAMYGSSKVADNDSFRVRYAELKLTLDLNEHLSAHFMLDPAREAGSFPAFPGNQGSGISGESDVFYNAGFDMANLGGNRLEPLPIGNVRNDLVRNGGGFTNKLLQDAYINFHDYVPHHDFTVGQFLRRLGEEGSRDNSQLDFIERAMITQIANVRDLGVQVHGSWLDQRAQYWIGGFNGAGTALQSRYNRADDNDAKDLVATYAVRPVWNNEKWGNLELGQTILYGRSGEHGSSKQTGDTVASDGLNRPSTVHVMQYAWIRYAPRSLLKGTWFEGEGLIYRDRFAPGEVAGYLKDASEFPAPFRTTGWYASMGYKMSDSIWADGLNKGGPLYRRVLVPMEFAFRYEDMGNLFIQSLMRPERQAKVYHTQVFTAGVNYYLSGYNARLQLNYNMVNEQHRDLSIDFDGLQVREVKNNNLILSLQLAW